MRLLPHIVAAFVLPLLLIGCQTASSAFMLGYTEMEAGGIQAVRAVPPSLAYRRLKARGDLDPIVKLFFQAKGYPDFSVEKPGTFRSEIVCFYSAKGHAYMLRTNEFNPMKTEILGPAPIGEKDKKLFKALQELEKAAAAYAETPAAASSVPGKKAR